MEINRSSTPDTPIFLSTGSFKTLEQFIIERQGTNPHSTGAFSRLLRDLSVAAKVVNRDVRRAGLVNILGDSGEINVQGEVQKKLDALAHGEFVRALKRGGVCCMIGSEEHAEAIPINASTDEDARYIVLLDPLDGSSNIDVNVDIGTIFSVYRLPEEASVGDVQAALMPGVKQVAAGYVVYGSSTMLVYTTGSGVNGFTLDPSVGEFLLSHPNIRTPRTGQYFSVNVGNYRSFEEGLRGYIDWAQAEDQDTRRPYSLRYIGSFVSDFHRNLLKGGIYIYPASTRDPEGKLRLMYEANPMAFLVEQAGGMATDGVGRILEKEPTTLHQRTPLFIGSSEMVQRAQSFLRQHSE
ncbi:MAG: class 1 fructose-bisphosphatase [Bacteroidota bacterium]